MPVTEELTTQIDNALNQGYQPDDVFKAIKANPKYADVTEQINTATKQGYPANDIFTAIKSSPSLKQPSIYDKGISTAKSQTLTSSITRPFKAQAYETAKSLNQGIAGFSQRLDDISQYISDKTGLDRGGLFGKAAKEYEDNAGYWDKRANEVGTTVIDEIVGSAVGGAIPGIADFSLGTPFYALAGAAEAHKQGKSEFKGAALEGVKRFTLGEIFKGAGMLKQPYGATASGTVFGAQTAAEGGDTEDIAKSAAVGVMYGSMGKGGVGLKDIKESVVGKKGMETKPSPLGDIVGYNAKDGKPVFDIKTTPQEGVETTPKFDIGISKEATPNSESFNKELARPEMPNSVKINDITKGEAVKKAANGDPNVLHSIQEGAEKHGSQVMADEVYNKAFGKAVKDGTLDEFRKIEPELIKIVRPEHEEMRRLDIPKMLERERRETVRVLGLKQEEPVVQLEKAQGKLEITTKPKEAWKSLSTNEQINTIGLNEKTKTHPYFNKLKKIVDTKWQQSQGKGKIYDSESNAYLTADYPEAKQIQDKIAKDLGVNLLGKQTGARMLDIPEPATVAEKIQGKLPNPEKQDLSVTVNGYSDPMENGHWVKTPIIETKPIEDAYTIGKRVRIGKSPQDYTITEEIPFDPKNMVEGERYFKAKNNKTGEIQEYEKEGITPIKGNEELEAKPIEGDIQAGSLAYGQDLPKYAGNINLERIDSPYAVKKTILDISDQYKGKMDEARRGKISLEETRKLADELGITEKDLLKRRKGQAFNAEEALAIRDILNTSATNLRKLQEEAVKLGSDEALIKYKLAIEQHAAIQAEVAGMTAEAGRALSSFRIKSQASKQTKNYKAMLDALGGRELTEDILKKFASIDIDNPIAVNKFIREVSKAKTSDMVFEAWVNGLLSGPQTHIVNTVSNLLTALTKPAESLISVTIEAGKQAITGIPKERFFGETKAEIIGSLQGIKDGVRAALNAYTTEMPADTMGKIETTKYQAIPSKTITIKGKEYEIGGKQVRIPTRLLMAADDFFKAIIYRSELNSQAYRIASSEGLKSKAKLDRMAELIDNPTDIMKQHAHEEAQYRTFTKPLGNIGNKLMSLRNETPLLKYIIPFLKTPTNIAKFGLERTPLNVIRLIHKKNKGDFKGAEFIDEMAKPILGSLIGATTVLLVKEGFITGGGSKDKTERDTLYRSGWQPYSVKIGDTYYGYNRLEPLGSIIGMSADFAELTTDKDREEVAGKIALSISKNLTSKTFMKGLSDTLDAIADPDRHGEKWINQFAGSLVPGVASNITRAKDEKLRQTETPIDTIKSRVPFVSETLLAKRDIFGREIERKGNFTTRLLSPIYISEESKDKVDKEMLRLMNIGDFKIAMPDKKIKGIELSTEEYDKYVKIAGERAKANLDKLVNGNQWDKIPDENKARIIKAIIQNQREVVGLIVLSEMDKNRIVKEYNQNRRLIKKPDK